jgi:hypothetical protein
VVSIKYYVPPYVDKHRSPLTETMKLAIFLSLAALALSQATPSVVPDDDQEK